MSKHQVIIILLQFK